MNSADFDTNELVEAIKRYAFLTSASGLTTDEILSYATGELRTSVTALLKSIREEYLIVPLDISITSSTIAAPARAVGAAFRTVGWVVGGVSYEIPRIEPERASQYLAQSASMPAGYMFQGNNIVLLPSQTSGTVRVSYQQRPGKLVLPDACGLISAVDTGAGTVTITQRPSTFTNSAVYDFVSSTPNFVAYEVDVNTVAAMTWSGNTVTFSPKPSWLSEIDVGDYLCLAGETCIPQIVVELHDYLAQSTAYRIAQAVGLDRAPQIQQNLADKKADVIMLLSPRDDGSGRPIISKSRIGRRKW